jgi:CTP:molybdopterin cytidylyltransferase MocA
MKWAGHAERMGKMKNVGELEGNTPVERPRIIQL